MYSIPLLTAASVLAFFLVATNHSQAQPGGEFSASSTMVNGEPGSSFMGTGDTLMFTAGAAVFVPATDPAEVFWQTMELNDNLAAR